MTVYRARPRTDAGTIVIHWGLALSVMAALATGLRIEAEGPSATAVDRLLVPLLPTWRLWLVHIVAGMALAGFLAAHVMLLRTAGLGARLQLRWDRISGLAVPGRARWSAASLILTWFFLVLAAGQVFSGLLIHTDLAPGLMPAHRLASWGVALFVPGHVALHVAMGGTQQLLRIVRPRPRDLSSVAGTRGSVIRRLCALVSRHGIAVATGLAFFAAVSAYLVAERHAHLTLRTVRVPELPGRTGTLDHPAWQNAIPLRVRTYGGANLEDGFSEVDVRAIHDGRRIALAFTWQDPVADVAAPVLVKTSAGWRIRAGTGGGAVDQFAVMVSPAPPSFGPGAFHPGQRPLHDKPPSGSGHGLHYTTDGSAVDVLHWFAGPAGGWCDLEVFGPPASPTAGQHAGREPYRGGIVPVATYGRMRPNSALAFYPGGPAAPRRLPSPGVPSSALAAPASAAGSLPATASIPYSADRDAEIELGDTLAGLLALPAKVVAGQPVACLGSWSAGRWTLVVERPLAPLRPGGQPIDDGMSIWVAPFDRTSSDHARHIRAVRLEVLP
ncbi:ethylbenzene dehydrogenase-related protein [Alsobacter sp. R-9]